MVYSALLVHEKEYVRSFAGESFAYLLRRLPEGKLGGAMGRLTEGGVLLDVLYQALLGEDQRLVEEEKEERAEAKEREREEREEREREAEEEGMEVDEEGGEEVDKKKEEAEEEEEEEQVTEKQRRLEDVDRRVGRAVRLFPMYVDGVTKLVWSTMKGVRGGLHSKAGGVFQAFLSSICPPPLSSLPEYSIVCGEEAMERMREGVGGKRALEKKKEGMVGKVLGQVMEGTNYTSMEPLWEMVDELWKEHLSSLKQTPPSSQEGKKKRGGKKKGEEGDEQKKRTTLSVADIRSFCSLLAAVRQLVGYRAGKHSLPNQKLWENISLSLQSTIWDWVFDKKGGDKEEEREVGVELLDGMLGLHGDCYGLLVRQARMGGGGGGGGEQELPPAYFKYLGASLSYLLKVVERGEEDCYIRVISRYLTRVCVYPSFCRRYLKGVVGYVVGLWEEGKKGKGEKLSVGQVQGLLVFSDIAWAQQQQQPPSPTSSFSTVSYLQKDSRKAFRPLQLLSSSPSSVTPSKKGKRDGEEEEEEEGQEVAWEMYKGLVNCVQQFAKTFEEMGGKKKKKGGKKEHVRGQQVKEVTEVDMMSLWLCLRGLSSLVPSISPSEFASSEGFQALQGLCMALLSLPSSLLDSPLLTTQSAAIQISDHKGKQQVFHQLPILPPSDLSHLWSPLSPPPLDGVYVWMREVAGLLVGEAMRAMGAMGKAVGKKEGGGGELVWGEVLAEKCFWGLLKRFSTDFHVVAAVADVVSWCCESLREQGGGGWLLPDGVLSKEGRVEVLECVPLGLSHPSLSLRSATIDLLCSLPLREGEEIGGEGGNGGLVMYEQFRGLMGTKMDALHSRDAIYRIDTQLMMHINNLSSLPSSEQKILVHFLVGLFHLHFAPVWRPTQNALAAISRTAPSSFYPLLSPFLVGRPAVDDLSLPPLPCVPDSYQLSSPTLLQQKWVSVDLSSQFYREVGRLGEDVRGTAVGGDSFFDSVWGVFCSGNFKMMELEGGKREKKGVERFPLHKYFWVLVSQYFPALLGKMTGDYSSALPSPSASSLPVGWEGEKDEGGDIIMANKNQPLAIHHQDQQPWAIALSHEEEEEFSFHPRGGLTWLEAKNKLRAILRVCEKMSPKVFPGGGEGGVFGAMRGVVGHMLGLPLPDIQVGFLAFGFGFYF